MYLLQIFLINKTQHKDSWFSIYCMWLKVMHSVYRLLLSLYMWFPLLFILYPRIWCIVHLCFYIFCISQLHLSVPLQGQIIFPMLKSLVLEVYLSQIFIPLRVLSS